VNQSAKPGTLSRVSDKTAEAVRQGRIVLRLMQLHDRQRAEARRLQTALSASTARKVEELLRERLPGTPAEAIDSPSPALGAAARIARSLPAELRRAISDKLPPELADEFGEALYSFDAIPSLAPRDLQQLIVHADKRVLATALLGADEAVRRAVTANMSSRAAQMLQ